MRFVDNTFLAIPKHWLFGLAGVLWSGVGVLLCARAIGWLLNFDESTRFAYGILGIVFAILMYNAGFHRVTLKNILRICSLPERASLFAFTAPAGYFMIGGMITIGILLRNSEIPKQYLATPYLAMGGSLLVGGYKLLDRFWRVVVRKEPCITLAKQTNSTP